MNRQKDERERFGIQPLRAVVALKNSSLWLRCFEWFFCLYILTSILVSFFFLVFILMMLMN
jgi:hypothetical protein